MQQNSFNYRLSILNTLEYVIGTRRADIHRRRRAAMIDGAAGAAGAARRDGLSQRDRVLCENLL